MIRARAHTLGRIHAIPRRWYTYLTLCINLHGERNISAAIFTHAAAAAAIARINKYTNYLIDEGDDRVQVC